MSYDAAALNAAIHRTNGEPEVSATWVNDHLGAFRFIDVREPHELTGPLGAVEAAENIPLLQLLSSPMLDASVPTVLLCRSGRRSTLAARELTNQGFHAVASVEGGMLAWNANVLGRNNVTAEEKQVNTHKLAEATFHTNGLPEVDAAWVQGNLGAFRFIDVREPYELAAEGAVAQAENIPLQTFLQRASTGDFVRDQPMVVMCKSGGRSGRATMALVGAGFTNVASMEGGMMGWRARGYAFR